MRKAFSLIELLTVCGIVALLTAVMLPSLSQARAQARRMQCANNLHFMGEALNVYKGDLNRYPDVGDRSPSKTTGSAIRPGDVAPRWGLANIGDLTQALVLRFLARPEPLYCPNSLYDDPLAPAPFKKDATGKIQPTWKTTGYISYIYLVGLQDGMTFNDSQGHPTFDPFVEAPDVLVIDPGKVRPPTRRLNRANPRVILAGDRTVEFLPGVKNIAGSNHGKSGGWFLYTTGDVLWGSWNTLTGHPGSLYTWYWPSLRKPSSS